jgi:hypothetical protein
MGPRHEALFSEMRGLNAATAVSWVRSAVIPGQFNRRLPSAGAGKTTVRRYVLGYL